MTGLFIVGCASYDLQTLTYVLYSIRAGMPESLCVKIMHATAII